MKKYCFLLLLLMIFFTGCGKMSEEVYNSKVKEFYTVFDKINKDLYPVAKEVVNNNGKPNKEFYDKHKDDISSIEKIVKGFENNNFPVNKEDEINKLKSVYLILLNIQIDCGIQSFSDQKISEESKEKAWKPYIEIAEERFKATNTDSKEVIKQSDPFKAFMEDKSVSLMAKDVQFDMANNLDKNFAISGVAELDDYYNYGFTNEKDYFCVQLTQDDGSYKNSWYLYFHRQSFDEFYNALKQKNIHVYALCKIPSNVYKKGQGNMAFVESLRW